MVTAVMRPTMAISTPQQTEYFTAQWKAYSTLQTRGQFTDLFLISEEGESVPVHRAILLPLSPYLAALVSEVWILETPTVHLPASTHILRRFVSLLYRGICSLSSNTLSDLLAFLANLGFYINPDRLQVQMVKHIPEVDRTAAADVVDTEPSVGIPSDTNGNIGAVEVGDDSNMNKDISTKVDYVIEYIVKHNKDYVEENKVNYKEVSIRKEIRVRKYECKICKEIFPSLRILRRHMEGDHDARLMVSCKRCDFKGVNRRDVTVHKYLCHVGKVSGVFSCGQCNFREDTEGKLMKHRKLRHTEKKYDNSNSLGEKGNKVEMDGMENSVGEVVHSSPLNVHPDGGFPNGLENLTHTESIPKDYQTKSDTDEAMETMGEKEVDIFVVQAKQGEGGKRCGLRPRPCREEQ